MIAGTSNPRKLLIWALLAFMLLVIWTARSYLYEPISTSLAQSSTPGNPKPHITNYLSQAYSLSSPPPFPYAGLREACAHAPWPEDADNAPYLNCVGMLAGITSIVSQVKVCLKMAVDTGSHLVLPRMPLRSSDDLTAFNFLNPAAYMAYDEWFDEAHLRDVVARACPRMRVVHPRQLDKDVAVRHHWEVSCANAPGYRKVSSFFWVGRPYRAFFEEELAKLRFLEGADPNRDTSRQGITVVDVDAEFLLFRITDDPTGRDLHLWNDLTSVIRFREEPRRIVDNLAKQIGRRPYYGVHFRVENDTIWSSLEEQLKRDLDALDRAWTRLGQSKAQKPLVYLACGDQLQVEKFVSAGAERGWEITHKWKLAQDDPETTDQINALPFDFQGVVDMGIMVGAQFFVGITGSAFSTTIAHLRDPTGRYRGSSFDVWDDDGAGSHLFFEGDTQYACCL